MHIVDITMFYARESGGVKRYLNAKQRWLRPRSPIQHTLLVPGSYDTVCDDSNTVTLRSPQIPFANGYRLPIGYRNWAQCLRTLRPDVIEVGDPYHLAWIAQRIGWERNIPVVGFYHSDLPRLVAMRFGHLASKLTERYVAELYQRFDLVLAPSRAMVDHLRSLGVQQAAHQPLGVDTACFTPHRRDPDLRAELGLNPKTRLLIYVGRFSREKNLPLLLAAMRRLGSGYHLILVGSGKGLPAQPNVQPLPYEATPVRVARLLASCDALVHPGDKETFGLIVLEAMSCGLPVVGMSTGGVAELVDSTVGQLAPPGNAERLAEAIAAVCAADRAKLQVNARARARRYSWDNVFSQLLHHYQGLSAQSGSTEMDLPLVHAGAHGDAHTHD